MGNEMFLQLLEIPFNTPDICSLECHNQHLLFDCAKPKLTRNVQCSAYTVEKMSLLIRKEDRLPIPIRLPGLHRARIGGALIKISTDELIELDKIKENRVLFERKRIAVYVPMMDVQRRVVVLPEEVWFYAAIPDVWREAIEHEKQRSNIPHEHCSFMKAETYTDNERLLNNHFRFSEKRMEDFRAAPPIKKATQAVADLVRIKNSKAVSHLQRLKSYLRQEHKALENKKSWSTEIVK